MKPSRRLLIVVLVGAVVAVLADVLLGGDEAHLWGEGVPGYWAVFGLVWTVVIVVASKWLGRVLLRQPEDFYDDSDADE
jgi:hypothetical protein